MKDLFPVCKDSRRLVNELLSNDGNNVLLVPVLVFEHQQPTARSHSRRSMLAVPASTFGLPGLCLARGRTAQQAPEDACSVGRANNDLTDAPYLQRSPSSCTRVWPRHDIAKYRFGPRRWGSKSTFPRDTLLLHSGAHRQGVWAEHACPGFTERRRTACACATPHRAGPDFFHFLGFFL